MSKASWVCERGKWKTPPTLVLGSPLQMFLLGASVAPWPRQGWKEKRSHPGYCWMGATPHGASMEAHSQGLGERTEVLKMAWDDRDAQLTKNNYLEKWHCRCQGEVYGSGWTSHVCVLGRKKQSPRDWPVLSSPTEFISEVFLDRCLDQFAVC